MDKREYDRPEPDEDKENRSWAISVLAAAVVLLLVGFAMGWIPMS